MSPSELSNAVAQAQAELVTAISSEGLGHPGSRNPESARDRRTIGYFSRLEELAPLRCSGLSFSW
jgi:hypothetical protein